MTTKEDIEAEDRAKEAENQAREIEDDEQKGVKGKGSGRSSLQSGKAIKDAKCGKQKQVSDYYPSPNPADILF